MVRKKLLAAGIAGEGVDMKAITKRISYFTALASRLSPMAQALNLLRLTNLHGFSYYAYNYALELW
jgi:hypothetical protein